MTSRRAAIILLVLLSAVSVSCAGLQGGLIYTHMKGPVAVTAESNDNGSNGVGESTVTTVFGLFAFGDASIEAAKRQGSKHPELVKVTHVDYEWHTFLGTGKIKVRVYFHDPTKAASATGVLK